MKIKLDDQGKQNVKNVLCVLNNANLHEIIYGFTDASLLPNDINKRSPNNMIPSVALKCKEENPIMLNSDNGLQLELKILDISTVFFEKLFEKKINWA